MTEQLRVTVIEDSPTQAIRIQHTLEEGGATVTCYSSAEDGLKRLDDDRPDLVIVDYHLPGIQGDEFCQRLRMNPRTRDIPLLMLTEDTTVQSERVGLESGADSYVSKQADADLLMLRIQSLVRNKHGGDHTLNSPDGLTTEARVLVVDDSPTFLELLRLDLEDEGYTVVTATSGEDALSLFKSSPIDCVIVDLVMPGMDGIGVCQELDRVRRSGDTSFGIIMLTSRDTKDDMMRGLEAGADDFVVKSNDGTVLRARIRALMRREMLRAENQRISREFRQKDEELARTMAEKKIAEEKAILAAELAETNKKLKETQSQLVQAAKMVSLGQLVAGIAHEINNPLAFVSANCDTAERSIAAVEKEIAGNLSEDGEKRFEKAKSRLSGMHDGLERIRELVLKLRTFSRLDEGEFKEVRLDETIDSVLTLLRHRFRDRIDVQTDLRGPETLNCAPGAFNQVLVNLVGNAIDAVGETGKILIRSEVQDDACTITIEDSGPGVPQDIRDHIFDPFFTTKSVGEGTGLGLSISYQIVQRHKGTMKVEESAAGGAAFVVQLPLDLDKECHNV